MPFTENWILDKITECHRAGRMAHAYLLTGSDHATLQHLSLALSRILLGDSPQDHADFHCIRPESKSRRLTVAQIRELEHELQLKSRAGGLKVGLVYSADRMCLGKAEAANAFLKTLEEPPDHTVIFLTSDRPDQLLSTIRSRCITLPLDSGAVLATSAEDMKRTMSWIETQGSPVARAYQRCQILSRWWQTLRADVEREYKKTTLAEDVASAQLESEFLLKRDNSIALLIKEIWKNTPAGEISHEFAISCLYLEELRSALQRNIDPNLALERCHLRVAQEVK
jgi:DNA polymerase-3 subunit delta'